jgi:hypothetical protein
MSESLRRIVELLGPESVTVLVDSTNRLTHAASILGVEISTDEVLATEAVRLACVADMPLDLERALEQLREVPSVAAKLQEKANAALVVQGHTEKIAGMSRTQKMNYARQHNLTGTQEEAPTIAKAEHLTILAGLSPGQKMSYARRHNLTGLS